MEGDDTLICLPVATIDEVVLELQELDYLREKSTLDSQLIKGQASEIDLLSRSNQYRDNLLVSSGVREEALKSKLNTEHRRAEAWKWGTVGVGVILVLKFVLAP